jgi:UPF0755 protein
MRRFFLFLLLLLIIAAGIGAWFAFSPATNFKEPAKYIYIRDENQVEDTVLKQLQEQNLVKNIWAFKQLANRMHVWERLKPGRFEIKKDESLINIARMLRNNRQSQVKLVINKLRTIEEFSRIIGKNFSTDSITFYQFIATPDSLRDNKLTDPLLTDTNTVLAAVVPNTYQFYWTARPEAIMQRLYGEQQKFWNSNNRKQKAETHGLTPLQVITIASIVEEETNKNDEKGNVASVYINRLRRNMPLQADPTIKFALRDFGLRRILHEHLDAVSPYNTYRNTGLPPGPICTPSVKTIDAVLDSPETDYIYFVADADLKGHHHFSSNYAEHMQYAKKYHEAVTEWLLKQANKAP